MSQMLGCVCLYEISRTHALLPKFWVNQMDRSNLVPETHQRLRRCSPMRCDYSSPMFSHHHSQYCSSSLVSLSLMCSLLCTRFDQRTWWLQTRGKARPGSKRWTSWQRRESLQTSDNWRPCSWSQTMQSVLGHGLIPEPHRSRIVRRTFSCRSQHSC